MAMRTPEIDGAMIVMIGSFNPAIFQPRWLATQTLIRPEEAENAKITLIRPEVADFSTDWFQLQVVQSRLSLSSQDPRHYGPLRDLATAIFTILPHTPITLLGLNRYFHHPMSSIEAWHGIGHKLAPKHPWTSIMEDPGLLSMTMQGRMAPSNEGVFRIKIEPSAQVKYGVYMEFNKEFRAVSDDEPDGASWVRDRLAGHWDAMMVFSEDAAEHLLRLTDK
jgi:hypothetical protein